MWNKKTYNRIMLVTQNSRNITKKSKTIMKKNAVASLRDRHMDGDLYSDSRMEENKFLRESGCFKVVPGSEVKGHSCIDRDLWT